MQHRKNSIIRACTAIIFVCVSLACATASADRVALIGFAARQTDAIVQSPRDAIEMAVTQANELPDKTGEAISFKLLVQDDQSNPNLAINIANYFVKSHVSGVIGHWYTVTNLATAEIYAAAHIPQINFTSSSSQFTKLGYQTTFRIIGGTDELATSLAEAAVNTFHGQHIIVIGNDSSYSTALTEVITSEVAKRSQNVVQSLTVSSQTSDFNTSLTVAMEKHPDLIIFSAYVTQMESFMNTVKRLGIKSKILFNDGATNLPLFDQDNNNVYAIEPGIRQDTCPRWKAFYQQFQHRYGYMPNTYARNAYNATAMLIEAIRKSNSTDAEKVTAHLHQMHYKGIAGEIAFSAEGALTNPTYTLYHAELNNWQPIKVFSADKKLAGGCPKD